jgi:hypothetical protein
MGYFSNGCEGMDYEERYCRRCVHYGPEEGPGCPIWLAHLLYAYTNTGSGSDAERTLDLLIPRTPDGLDNEQCALFVEAAA